MPRPQVVTPGVVLQLRLEYQSSNYFWVRNDLDPARGPAFPMRQLNHEYTVFHRFRDPEQTTGRKQSVLAQARVHVCSYVHERVGARARAHAHGHGRDCDQSTLCDRVLRVRWCVRMSGSLLVAQSGSHARRGMCASNMRMIVVSCCLDSP